MDIDEHGIAFFFEIHSNLPREGPGDTESTRRALSMMAGLPERPSILDVGCGPGMQIITVVYSTSCRKVSP